MPESVAQGFIVVRGRRQVTAPLRHIVTSQGYLNNHNTHRQEPDEKIVCRRGDNSLKRFGYLLSDVSREIKARRVYHYHDALTPEELMRSGVEIKYGHLNGFDEAGQGKETQTPSP